jgi:hypothetical protein
LRVIVNEAARWSALALSKGDRHSILEGGGGLGWMALAGIEGHSGSAQGGAADVCRALGLDNTSKALMGLEEGEKITLTFSKGNPRAGMPHQLADVCRALGIKNSRDAAANLDEDEKDDVGLTDAIGRTQIMTVVAEPGLYSLILRSRKPAAKGLQAA